jgi:hypothetical protein
MVRPCHSPAVSRRPHTVEANPCGIFDGQFLGGSLRLTTFGLLSIIPALLYTHLFLYHRRYIILTTDSVFK